MPFIANPTSPADEATIENFSEFWPAFDPSDVRQILRLESDITTARLTALLQNAIIDINEELTDYVDNKQSSGISFEEIPEATQHQYRRAVYATAQAQLLSDMRDYDTTATGQDRADETNASIDVQLRVATLAVRSILGKPSSHIELI